MSNEVSDQQPEVELEEDLIHCEETPLCKGNVVYLNSTGTGGIIIRIASSAAGVRARGRACAGVARPPRQRRFVLIDGNDSPVAASPQRPLHGASQLRAVRVSGCGARGPRRPRGGLRHQLGLAPPRPTRARAHPRRTSSRIAWTQVP